MRRVFYVGCVWIATIALLAGRAWHWRGHDLVVGAEVLRTLVWTHGDLRTRQLFFDPRIFHEDQHHRRMAYCCYGRQDIRL